MLTHSASGPMGWVTATRADNVKAIVSYEPVGWLFPDNEVPAPVPTSGDPIVGTPIAPALFQKLTHIPIQIVFGDNIPTVQSPHPGLDAWRGRLVMARRFVEVVNAHGGHAELLSLPAIGVRGNTHFAFSDLNNVKIADLLSEYLHKERLDLPMKGQTPRHTHLVRPGWRGAVSGQVPLVGHALTIPQVQPSLAWASPPTRSSIPTSRSLRTSPIRMQVFHEGEVGRPGPALAGQRLPGPSTGPIEQLTGRREPDRIRGFLAAHDRHQHRNRLARIDTRAVGDGDSTRQPKVSPRALDGIGSRPR
jgi:hypothetical protein